MAAVFLLLERDARFAATLAGDAAFDAGQGFHPLRRNRLTADFAEDGRLPVGVVSHRIVIDGLQPLLFAERAGHPRSRFGEQHDEQLFVGIGVAAQHANEPQSANGVVAATDGPPPTFSADKFAGKHNALLPRTL